MTLDELKKQRVAALATCTRWDRELSAYREAGQSAPLSMCNAMGDARRTLGKLDRAIAAAREEVRREAEAKARSERAPAIGEKRNTAREGQQPATTKLARVSSRLVTNGENKHAVVEK